MPLATRGRAWFMEILKALWADLLVFKLTAFVVKLSGLWSRVLRLFL